MQKQTHKWKPTNDVGNPDERSMGKLILPPLPCRDMTACVQNKDSDMESKTISRGFFSTFSRARVDVENHWQGQIWVEGMRVRNGCRLQEVQYLHRCCNRHCPSTPGTLYSSLYVQDC
jgi:hypothetical protein